MSWDFQFTHDLPTELAGASYAGQATTFAWVNQICADDDQLASMILKYDLSIIYNDAENKKTINSNSMCNNIINGLVVNRVLSSNRCTLGSARA
ncbi:hypothetical protein BYT27DRAFT_7249647 [Phlegmacium glaucopus]|nr:hypothetical protein BYT27DRAFT_7249647 [Phlegmacium glaucopus]